MSIQSVSLDLDSGLIERLDRLARTERRERDQLLAEALEAFATSEEQFIAAVEEGISAADRAEFADTNEVKERFAKWGVDVDRED